ncbi:MAG TPA: phosphotransferase [Blastocatellia bacterium]|nr:phosphotransferase [Blastocatellia bacterium]
MSKETPIGDGGTTNKEASLLSAGVLELAAKQIGATPTDLITTKLAGDASSRSYFRLRTGSSTCDSPGIIVALYPEAFDETESASSRLERMEAADPNVRLTFANDPCAHIEVTSLFLAAGVPVPGILSSSGGDRVLLMEDAGDLNLQDWLEGKSRQDRAAIYREAIDFIIRIQEATGLAMRAGSISSRLAFDEAKLKWELDFFFTNFVGKYLGYEPAPSFAQEIDAEFTRLSRELASAPRVLVHRDYHARNLMPGRRMFVIDHQDARMGPATYDLASLLFDPYARLDAGLIDELTGYFVEARLKSSLPTMNASELRHETTLVALQRMLKAVGTYAYQVEVKRNQVYAPYIQPALESAIGCIRSLGRFEHLRALLSHESATKPLRVLEA